MGYIDKQSHHGLMASARSSLSERGWSTEVLERQLDHKEANQAVAVPMREANTLMSDGDSWLIGALVQALESGDNVIPLRGVA